MLVAFITLLQFEKGIIHSIMKKNKFLVCLESSMSLQDGKICQDLDIVSLLYPKQIYAKACILNKIKGFFQIFVDFFYTHMNNMRHNSLV
jgi:hypothetical protein